jgi:predicted metal-dependent hydrolase
MSEIDPGREALREGVLLYNAGEYYEAHEVLEGPWRSMVGLERDVYQALIKAAAGFHHAGRGKLNPAGRLLGRAIDQLGPRVAEWTEQDLAPFLAALNACRAELQRLDRSGETFDPAIVPELPLPG